MAGIVGSGAMPRPYVSSEMSFLPDNDQSKSDRLPSSYLHIERILNTIVFSHMFRLL